MVEEATLSEDAAVGEGPVAHEPHRSLVAVEGRHVDPDREQLRGETLPPIKMVSEKSDERRSRIPSLLAKTFVTSVYSDPESTRSLVVTGAPRELSSLTSRSGRMTGWPGKARRGASGPTS